MLITRFAFRDSIESNICALHDKMKTDDASKFVVTGGVLPAAAVRLLEE